MASTFGYAKAITVPLLLGFTAYKWKEPIENIRVVYIAILLMGTWHLLHLNTGAFFINVWADSVLPLIVFWVTTVIVSRKNDPTA